MEPNKPKVSVLMPVYNGEEYLQKSIESVLHQTFTDFEFLIIDDGSTDGSSEIIKSYSDPRIRYFENEKNVKLITTLNRGLNLARGEYVARMDCDDISVPQRLEKQVRFMDMNPNIGVCGSWLETFGDRKRKRSIWQFAADPDVIKVRLLFSSSLAHPSVILRRALFERFDLRYDLNYIHCEDWELWQRCSQYFELANIPEVLVKYRINPKGIGHTFSEEQRKTIERINRDTFTRMGLSASDEEISLHTDIAFRNYRDDKKFITSSDQWLQRLIQANNLSGRYLVEIFNRVVSEHWFAVCNNTCNLGPWVFKRYITSPIRTYYRPTKAQWTKFGAKCIVRHGRRLLNTD